VGRCFQVPVEYPAGIENKTLLGVLNRQQPLDTVIKKLSAIAELPITVRNNKIVVAD
jgi:hypothetical protein